jgi:hypothetical protein
MLHHLSCQVVVGKPRGGEDVANGEGRWDVRQAYHLGWGQGDTERQLNPVFFYLQMISLAGPIPLK